MTSLSANATSLRPGQVISFVYTGGTRSGETRLVRIKQTDVVHIAGEDLTVPDSDNFRNFNRSGIRNNIVELVADANEDVIPIKEFVPANVTTDIDAATILNIFTSFYPDRKAVRYEPKVKAVIVKSNNFPRIDINASANKVTLNFFNGAGERLELSFEADGVTPLAAPIHCRMDSETMAGFISDLAEHHNKGIRQDGGLPKSMNEWHEFYTKQVASGRGGIYANSNSGT